MADDMLLVRENGPRSEVHPFLPKVKLWDDSLEALGEQADGFPRVMTGVDKRRVGTEVGWVRPATAALRSEGCTFSNRALEGRKG